MRAALITPKQWFDSPELVHDWAQTWREPHMVAGMKVLIALGLPESQPFRVGVPWGDTALHRMAKSEGYYDALRAIDKLMRPKTTTELAELAEMAQRGDGWGTANLDDPAAEAAPTTQ